MCHSIFNNYILKNRCFSKAIESYQKALRCLGERKSCPEVWDTVTWELSGAYYTLATLLQDYAPLTTHAQEEVF